MSKELQNKYGRIVGSEGYFRDASDFHRSLAAHGIAYVTNNNFSQLIAQTEPGDTMMVSQLLRQGAYGPGFDLYAYMNSLSISNLTDILSFISKHDYTICFDFDPDNLLLSITLDTRIISIESLKRIVAKICARYGKTLDSDL